MNDRDGWKQGTVFFVTQSPGGSPAYRAQICWNTDRFIEAQRAASAKSLTEKDTDKHFTFAVVGEAEYRAHV